MSKSIPIDIFFLDDCQMVYNSIIKAELPCHELVYFVKKIEDYCSYSYDIDLSSRSFFQGFPQVEILLSLLF